MTKISPKHPILGDEGTAEGTRRGRVCSWVFASENKQTITSGGLLRDNLPPSLICIFCRNIHKVEWRMIFCQWSQIFLVADRPLLGQSQKSASFPNFFPDKQNFVSSKVLTSDIWYPLLYFTLKLKLYYKRKYKIFYINSRMARRVHCGVNG